MTNGRFGAKKSTLPSFPFLSFPSHFSFFVTLSAQITFPVLSYHPVMTLSVEKREVALRLRKQGMSNAKVAAALGVDRSTIIRLLERVRDTGDITPKSSSGRPRMFAPRDERELVRIVRRDPTAPHPTSELPSSTPVHASRRPGLSRISFTGEV